jgi:alpha-glucuronidase
MPLDYNKPVWATPRLPDVTRDKAWLAHGYSIGLKPSVSSFQTGSATPGITWKAHADAEIRMINHRDNIDGSIERGYSGRSIFFENSFR